MTIVSVDHSPFEVANVVEDVPAVVVAVEPLVVVGEVEPGVVVVEESFSRLVGVLDSGLVVVVVPSDVPGAAASTGESGFSPTRSSATATICHATTVVATTASSQPPASLQFMAFIVPTRSRCAHQRTIKVSSRSVGPWRSRYNLTAVARIALIEDDVEIRRLVAEALSAEGHHVESADRAMEGLELAIKRSPELVLMDLGLPDLDGAELLRMIRAVSQVPVIVITARGEDDDVVATLNAGADDYLVKPFSVAQLEARVRAILRRSLGESSPGPIVVGGLTVETGAREVTLDGHRLDLSPKEFDLLRVLAERAGDVVGKRELLAEVWREPYGGSDRTIDVHLSWLRGKLGESAQEPRYLHTVHGVGVKLVDPTR